MSDKDRIAQLPTDDYARALEVIHVRKKKGANREQYDLLLKLLRALLVERQGLLNSAGWSRTKADTDAALAEFAGGEDV